MPDILKIRRSNVGPLLARDGDDWEGDFSEGGTIQKTTIDQRGGKVVEVCRVITDRPVMLGLVREFTVARKITKYDYSDVPDAPGMVDSYDMGRGGIELPGPFPLVDSDDDDDEPPLAPEFSRS